MKDDKSISPEQAERDMLQVLQAERDAEQTVRHCEDEVQQIISDVQRRVQRITTCADQRITNMEMRHGHKLNNLVNDIERQGAAALRIDAAQPYDRQKLQAVINKLADDLCMGDVTSGHVAADDETAGNKMVTIDDNVV